MSEPEAEKHGLPEGWSPHGTGYRREDGWVVRPYGEGRWCTVTPRAVLFGLDMPRTSAAAIARVPPIDVEPEDACEGMEYADEPEVEVEAKALVAANQYSERAGQEVWNAVTADEIAEHVREGWTVEAVQWSDEPGDALCVVLRRCR